MGLWRTHQLPRMIRRTRGEAVQYKFAVADMSAEKHGTSACAVNTGQHKTHRQSSAGIAYSLAARFRLPSPRSVLATPAASQMPQMPQTPAGPAMLTYISNRRRKHAAVLLAVDSLGSL